MAVWRVGGIDKKADKCIAFIWFSGISSNQLNKSSVNLIKKLFLICLTNCKGPHTINTANVGSTRDLISQNAFSNMFSERVARERRVRERRIRSATALIRRAMKLAGPSKKVWCSRLRSTETKRFHLHSNLDFEGNYTKLTLLCESATLLRHVLFWGNGKRWVFQGWKQDFKKTLNENYKDLLALVIRVSFWL